MDLEESRSDQTSKLGSPQKQLQDYSYKPHV